MKSEAKKRKLKLRRGSEIASAARIAEAKAADGIGADSEANDERANDERGGDQTEQNQKQTTIIETTDDQAVVFGVSSDDGATQAEASGTSPVENTPHPVSGLFLMGNQFSSDPFQAAAASASSAASTGASTGTPRPSLRIEEEQERSIEEELMQSPTELRMPIANEDGDFTAAKSTASKENTEGADLIEGSVAEQAVDSKQDSPDDSETDTSTTDPEAADAKADAKANAKAEPKAEPKAEATDSTQESAPEDVAETVAT